MKVSQTIKDAFPHMLGIIIIVGIVVALSNGISPLTFTTETWGKLSVGASVILGISLCSQIYKHEVIDRLLLGNSMFMFVGAIRYLGNISYILYLYGTYPFAVLSGFLAIVGVLTFFTPASFIGVESHNKNKVYIASLKLLSLVVALGLWTLSAQIYLNASFPFRALPFWVVYLIGDRLLGRLKGEKPKKIGLKI